MSYLAIPVNASLSVVEGMASVLGLKLRVDVSDHSINVSFVRPDKDTHAWDSDLYRNANLFVSGYANPIKPRVNHNPDLEHPDTVDVTEGESEDDTEDTDGPHVNLISSSRYRDYMRQDLVSQLLTPQEQWKLIAYGVLGLAIIQFFSIIITLYATGSF